MVTILLPISRTDFLRPVFNCLKELEKPDDTELLIITDGDKSLQEAVDKRLDLNFTRIRVVNFGDKPEQTIDSRRHRISAIHNFAKHYIKGDYVLSLEDDTTYPPDTLMKLLFTIDTYPSCAFVQGVEMGRHATPYIGGWRADNVHNPKRIESVAPGSQIEHIDAGGLYCALIDAEIYRMHQFQPFNSEIRKGLSCDLNLGLYLRQQGYKCLMDWSIQCDHIGDKGSVNLGNTRPVRVVFELHDKWEARTEGI